jgi:hypothetical protein
MRGYYTMRIINGGAQADVSYDSVFTAVWSYIECALGIVVACSLSVPKLFQAKGKNVRASVSKMSESLTARARKGRVGSKSDPLMPTTSVTVDMNI